MIRRLLPISLVLVVAALAPASASAKPARALKLSVSSTKSVVPGRLGTVTAKVTNTGRRTATRVRLSVKAGSGVAVSKTRIAVTSKLGPRASKKVRIKVRLRAPSAALLRLTVSASRTRAVRRGVRIAPAGLAGRYFWRTEYIVGTSYYYGYYFVDSKWAYRGIPEGGLPSCTKRTAPDAKKDGCVPYRYDAKTRKLTVDGKTGTLEKPHQIAVDGDSYAEAVVPAAGTRLQATGQYINSYGVIPYATFVTVGIELKSDGQFGRSSAISGSTPGTDFAALPPDQHGTYAIGPAGRITYRYADGKVKAETIGILYDKTEKPNANYGMLLDDGVFFGPDSDVN